jgi:hypothetical protein
VAEQINPLDRKIYWLASYPKSGNTWIRMFLNAYSSGFPLDINSVFQMVKSDHHPGVFQLTCGRNIESLAHIELFMYYQAVLLNMLHVANSKDIFLKTHNAKVSVDGMVLIPPSFSAAAVYIIRDPRDVAISVASHYKVDIDAAIKMICDEGQMGMCPFTKLRHILLSWSKHIESWTVTNKNVPVIVVKYEDLLVDPVPTFQAIIKHMGLPDFGPERFEFALEQTNFEKLRKQEDTHGFKESNGSSKFFRVGKAGQWKSVLTKSQVKTIEKTHKEMMERCQYDLVTQGKILC